MYIQIHFRFHFHFQIHIYFRISVSGSASADPAEFTVDIVAVEIAMMYKLTRFSFLDSDFCWTFVFLIFVIYHLISPT